MLVPDAIDGAINVSDGGLEFGWRGWGVVESNRQAGSEKARVSPGEKQRHAEPWVGDVVAVGSGNSLDQAV